MVGIVGAGGDIYPLDSLPLIPRRIPAAEIGVLNCETVDAPPGRCRDGIVAVRISGTSILPFMRPGRIAYYAHRGIGGADDGSLNRLCVVMTADGRGLLKVVHNSHMACRFDLISHNMETISAVELARCAPVVFIKPA